MNGPYFILLDNASIHKTKAVRALVHELGVELVYNVAYSPWFNGIETYWSQAKRIYRDIGTKTLIRGERRDLEAEARRATQCVTDYVTKRCAEGGLNAIRRIGSQPH